MGDKPATTIRIGGVKASVWKNETEDGRVFSVTQFTRSYRDKEDNWQETSSFSTDDLPKLELAARKAFEFAHTEMLEPEQAQETFQDKVTKSRGEKAAAGRSK